MDQKTVYYKILIYSYNPDEYYKGLQPTADTEPVFTEHGTLQAGCKATLIKQAKETA